MIRFLDCARRHVELASPAAPVLADLVSEVEAVARSVATRPLVRGRIKGLLSTWLKARAKRRSVDSMSDLVGVRVIVDQEEECYAVLDALRARWRTVEPPEDYIGRPKKNGYASLHAILEHPLSFHFEVQIRTRAMDEACGRGQLAHWLYKRRQLAEAAGPAQQTSVPLWLREDRRSLAPLGREWRHPEGAEDHGTAWCRQVGFVATAGAMVGAVCLFDYLSGEEVGFSVLYVIPVAFASWRVSGTAGLAMAALSTAAWWLTDRASPIAVNPLVQMWDAVMRFSLFGLLGHTLAGLRAALAQLARAATTDHLTGALNSRGFFAVAAAELERARRYQRPLTAVFIDLDDFKLVNDRLGHGPADDLLRRWAQAVRQRLRASDHLARLGGDEFAILLPETPAEAARELLERLRGGLADESRQLTLPVTFSMGAVTFASAPASIDSMLHEADVLMYAAKAGGKDRWQHEARSGAP